MMWNKANAGRPVYQGNRLAVVQIVTKGDSETPWSLEHLEEWTEREDVWQGCGFAHGSLPKPMSKRGWLPGMLTERTTRNGWRRWQLAGRMEVLGDHNNLKEPESSTDVFQSVCPSVCLAGTRPIPKRLRQDLEGAQPIPPHREL